MQVNGEVKARIQLASKKPIQSLAAIESICLLSALSGDVHVCGVGYSGLVNRERFSARKSY